MDRTREITCPYAPPMWLETTFNTRYIYYIYLFIPLKSISPFLLYFPYCLDLLDSHVTTHLLDCPPSFRGHSTARLRKQHNRIVCANLMMATMCKRQESRRFSDFLQFFTVTFITKNTMSFDDTVRAFVEVLVLCLPS